MIFFIDIEWFFWFASKQEKIYFLFAFIIQKSSESYGDRNKNFKLGWEEQGKKIWHSNELNIHAVPCQSCSAQLTCIHWLKIPKIHKTHVRASNIFHILFECWAKTPHSFIYNEAFSEICIWIEIEMYVVCRERYRRWRLENYCRVTRK